MKTLLIDLDGVLNTYTGDYRADFIPPIREGAHEFLKELSQNYIIKIFTTREKTLAEKWVCENGLKNIIQGITNYKEPCYMIIDDRCQTFTGNYPETINKLQTFKPWYRSITN